MTSPAVETSVPQFPEAALYGLAGRIVNKLLPQTESHSAALLIETLVRYGNLIGSSAYYEVEGRRHHGNLFAVKVGESAKARKGTASARIQSIFESVADPAWLNRQFSGLSSGEGIVAHLHDHRPAESGLPADKRMLVSDGEFASTLSVMKREGNTLSTAIRNCWDGTALQVTNKNSPLRATNHHVSIIADITQGELQTVLRETDKWNGFANRFLWLHVERTKKLPFGGQKLDWTEEIEQLKKAVKFACAQGRIEMDESARELWSLEYDRLSEGQPGILGAITNRAEAQSVRLALLFALLDESLQIRAEHLRAAIALWDYCADSARFIFGGLSGEQHRILDFCASARRTKTDIYRGLFGCHRKSDMIAADVAELVQKGLLTPIKLPKAEAYTTAGGGA